MGSPIVWFELRTKDVERAKEFYGALFGWTFTSVEDADRPYWVISTQDGVGSGGLRQSDVTGGQDITLYVAVEEMHATVAIANVLGATVEAEPREISPDVGWSAILRDPVGVRIGLWSPQP